MTRCKLKVSVRLSGGVRSGLKIDILILQEVGEMWCAVLSGETDKFAVW